VLSLQRLELGCGAFIIIHSASVTESLRARNLNRSSTTRAARPPSGEMGQDKSNDS
jgi:hypothetical protein